MTNKTRTLVLSLVLSVAAVGPAIAASADSEPATPRTGPADLPLPSTGGSAPTSDFCVVPKLAGKRVAQARVALRAHGCRLGRVTKVRSAKARTGKVVAQSIAPGYTVPPGAKISVLVGKGRR